MNYLDREPRERLQTKGPIMRDYAKTIGRLIAKAESAQEMGNAEEALAYRTKAETLMREYRIEEEQTIAGDAFSILPRRFEIVILEFSAILNPLRWYYSEIWAEIARHAGVKSTITWRYPDDEASEERLTAWVAVGYGYESDVRLAELLWTSARLVFMARIDARKNPELSDAENCYFMRNSGMKRNDIAHALWKSAYDDGHAHGKVQKLYLAECAKRGEQPRVAGRGIQVALYRKAYAESFTDEFGWRLREARDAADAQGGALELPGRAERVAEAFYAEFPQLRPMTPEEREARLKDLAERPECAACAKTTSKTGKCRRCRPSTVTAADRRRWERETSSPEATAGRANGAAAARSVNVSRTAEPRSQRTEAAPVRPQIG